MGSIISAPGKQIGTSRLEGPIYEAGRWGSVSCLLPQISCDLGWIASCFFSYQFRISEDNPCLPSCFLSVVILTSVGSRLPYMPARRTPLTGAMCYCNAKIANAGPWVVAVNKCPSPADSVGSSAVHWWERHSLHCVNVQNKGWEGIWALYKYNLEVNTREGKELFLSKRTM